MTTLSPELLPPAPPPPPGSSQGVPFGILMPLRSPERLTTLELEQIYNNPKAVESMWLPEKIWTAMKYETLTGEFVRDFFLSPEFAPDPSFKVTQELIQKYASDLKDRDGLPLGPDHRVFEGVRSLPAFLHEIHDYRVISRKRQAMFSGGALGAIGGFVATMLGAAPEAIAATILAAKAGTALGPAGTVAAGTATAGARLKRFNAIFSAVRASGRARAMAKAGAFTTAVDIPMELARHAMDKSLTTTDIVLGVSASVGLGQGLAAWKPHLFSRHAAASRKMAEDSAKEEFAEAAARSGRQDLAEEATPPTPKLRLVTDDEIVEEVSALSVRAMKREAKERGIPGFAGNVKLGSKKHDDLILALSEARRKENPGVDAAVAQAQRMIDDIKGTPQVRAAGLRKLARDLDIRVRANIRSTAALQKAILRGVRAKAASGTTRVSRKVRFKKGELGRGGVSVTVAGVKRGLTFATRVQEALYKVGSSRTDMDHTALIAKLKEAGIEDPAALGRELRAAVRAKADELGGVEGKIHIEADELLGKPIFKGRERFTMQIDEDLFDHATARQAGLKNEAGETPHPVAGERQQRLETEDGEVAGTGKFAEEDGEYDAAIVDVDLTPSNAPKRGVTGHGQGFRETVARAIEGAYNNVPILSKYFNNVLTGVGTRLRAMNSQEVRNAAEILMETARHGGNNAQTAITRNHASVMVRFARTYKAAQDKAKAAGRTLDDDRILKAHRAGTAEELLDEADAMVVGALRKFNKDLLKYAQKHGIMKDGAVFNPASYFHRMYRHTAFDAFSEEELLEFFTKALRAKHPQMREAKLREIAKRTVSYGRSPEAHTTSKAAGKWFDQIRDELSENQRSLGLSDEDLDDIVDAVRGQVRDDAHLHGFARRRIDYDETFETVINGKRMAFGDFFQNDILGVTNQYAHKVLGAVEMKKVMIALFGENISKASAMRRLKAAAAEAGDDADYVETAMDFAMRRISGEKLFDAGPKAMGMAMNAQALAQGTMGMKLGIAQIPEMMSVLCHAGIRNAVTAMPSLKDLGNTFLMGIRKEKGLRGSDGRLLDEAAAELESYVGCAHEYVTKDYILRRLDDMGYDGRSNPKFGGFLEKGRLVSLLSPIGIMPMDTFLRRWAVKSHFQRFVNDAYKIRDGKPILNSTFWRRDIKRYRDIGLEGDDLARVMKALADPGIVTTRKGMFGNYIVKNIDLSKVKDPGAFDLLAVTLRRQVDSTIQRQTMGELPLWMTSNLAGKVLTQYRVFVVGSRAKQFAAGIARADAMEAVNVVGSCALGTLGYTLLTYGRALEVSPHKREAWWEEQFTTENLVKSGIMRSSYSNVIPMMMDTFSFATTGEAMFSGNMRTSTQGIGIEGTVPASMYKQITHMVTEGAESLAYAFSGGKSGSPLSKRDLRDLMRIFWMFQMPGIDQAADHLISESSIRETDRSMY